MIILNCLQFFNHNGYVMYVLLLTWLCGLLVKAVSR